MRKPQKKYRLTMKAYKKARGYEATSLVEYALSGESYIQRENILHHNSKNMPVFAKNDFMDFWRSVDIYEISTRNLCREITMVLPENASTPELIYLMEKFTDDHLEKHPLTYAIHERDGFVHSHIFFSDREDDGVVRSDPEKYFKKSNTKEPEKGGCPKAPKWLDRGGHLDKVKSAWEHILINFFKRNNIH